MGPAIPDFGAGGGCVHQDVRDILRGSGSGGAPVWVGYVGHDPAHCQDAGGISPSGGPSAVGYKNAEGRGRDLKAPPSGCGDGRGRSGGGGDLCCPPPEHSRTVHLYPYDHGPVSRGDMTPWGKVLQKLVGTRESGPCGGMVGGYEGGGGGQIRDQEWDGTLMWGS